MHDISIDIETLSTRHDAAILSIGAVVFDRETGELGENFYVTVDIDSAIANGHVLGSTLAWWMQQNEAAKGLFDASEKCTLAEALFDLSIFVRQREGARVWGNGATFDITILEHAYSRVNLAAPWKFWEIRDMRTLVEAAAARGFNKVSVPFEGEKHNAMDDAVHQARVIAHSWTARCAPAAPQGYKLVPIEATPAMTQAGQDAGKSGAWSYSACYRAMLAAAPVIAQPAPQATAPSQVETWQARFARFGGPSQIVAMEAEIAGLRAAINARQGAGQ